MPIYENSSLVNISGFIGKPDVARRTRGEQYFFVNKRFIKNNYLNHAIDDVEKITMAKAISKPKSLLGFFA